MLDNYAFKTEPSESNRVWITGRSMEEWLGARVGMSRCCSVCGDSDCRTLEVEGHTHETTPEEMFIKAGLLAASQLLAREPAHEPSTSPCCESARR